MCDTTLEYDMFGGTRRIARLRAVASGHTALRELAVDVLLKDYVSWREECAAVWLAYRRWTEAAHAWRAAAYVEYAAALDREELAAGVYARQLRVVRRVYG
jgi:hypothetical protein